MKQKIKEQKGITLVALVVTIIVLLILAAVSIGMLFDGDGLFKIASKSAESHKVEKIREDLELLKQHVMTNNLDGFLQDSLGAYLKELEQPENMEKYKVTSIERIDKDNAEIVIEGKYEYAIYMKSGQGLVIEYQGDTNTGLLELSEKRGEILYPNTRTFEITKNVSGGELSVKSSDDSIATATIEGNIVTVTSKMVDEEKSATITVISAPNGEYRQLKAKYLAIIKKGDITVNYTPFEGDYDGNTHPVVTNVSTEPPDAKITYSVDGGETFTEEIPEIEGSGEYTVIIKVEKEGYEDKIITETITVNKKKNGTGSLELSSTSGTITYPTPGTTEITKNESGGAITVTSSDESIATVKLEGNQIIIIPQVIDEDGKKITITIKSETTSNYEEQIITYEVTVNRGRIELEVSEYSATTDGNSHPAVTITKLEPPDTKVTYSIDGGVYTETIPTITEIGAYNIKIKAEKARICSSRNRKNSKSIRKNNRNRNRRIHRYI